MRAATTATTPPSTAPVGVRPATAIAVARHHAAPCSPATTMAGSSTIASTSDHWPCSSRSTVNGFHSSIVTAANCPNSPAPTVRRANSAAARPPNRTPATSRSRTTAPASVNPPTHASTASCGVARAAESPSPNAASVNAGCGGTTMSRSNSIPGDANGHSSASDSRNVHPNTTGVPKRAKPAGGECRTAGSVVPVLPEAIVTGPIL